MDPAKKKVFDSVCIVGFCWISKLPIWRSHDLPFWKGIFRIDTLREDIMAMEHPRFPFHRKYVFECFILIDHNVKNIHILAQLQVTWCYEYVNNWLVDSTHGFQPHSQFAHLFWLSARAVKFRKHICLIRNLRNKHKEFFGWKGLCWIGKIFGWFQRGSIFNPIEEIFVNLDEFPIGRPGKHVPNSLSHHLVTWNLQSWILQNIIDTWYIFASPTNTQKCHQWIRVSISLGREHWRGISLSKTLGIQNMGMQIWGHERWSVSEGQAIGCSWGVLFDARIAWDTLRRLPRCCCLQLCWCSKKCAFISSMPSFPSPSSTLVLCIFFVQKIEPPGTPNNHFVMDVWWNHHFLCSDLESSRWNNHKKPVAWSSRHELFNIF